MYKYFMNIDGSRYVAMFVDHFEADDFITENERDGSVVTDVKYIPVSADDILHDTDFNHATMIEYLAIMLLPNHRDFDKWDKQEAELHRLGYI